jgi:hypothetical protein
MNTTAETSSGTRDVESRRVQLRQIYDTYRTALLNRKYYAYELSKQQNRNTCFEIIVAVGATGSGGIAGLAVWKLTPGFYVWIFISGTAAVLSVTKPILQLGKRIEEYTKLYTGYTSVYLELKTIVEDIEVLRYIPPKVEDKYLSIRVLMKELGVLNKPKQDDKLILRFQSQVNKEIPPENLWMP